jgi:hypothetical protein
VRGNRTGKGYFVKAEVETPPVGRKTLHYCRNTLRIHRDIAGGDLVGWIDDQLDQADAQISPNASAQPWHVPIEPLHNVYGVSDKVLAMALSANLIGAVQKVLRG